VFEPRYLNLTTDALGAGRTMGMVQPQDDEDGEAPPVFRTGCLGRIVAFSETEDGRFLLTLEGVCRFDVAEELPLHKGYRRVVADYAAYSGDLTAPEDVGLDRDRLLTALKVYFKTQGISADWGQIETAPDERLVTTLAMVCPFSPTEKQALLECRDAAERSSVLTALVEMAALNRGDDPGEPSRH
jgi:Lon protease-like protein